MFENLNDSQKEAVQYTDGPLMVLAGAGSGKTKMLVSRISYLIEEKRVGPYRVLALTFSNKAAKEMRERISKNIKIDIGSLQVTTFHSFCARLLRSEASYLGLSKNFTIYDDSESRAVIKGILSRHGISTKDVSPYDLLYSINQIKNWGYFETSREKIPEGFDLDEFTLKLYREYERELHKANALDFGGLITTVLQLFNDFSEVLERYQSRFEYILVDEYQDTNRAQFNLIKMLSDRTQNLCVVGDEDQSIYSWRGADINNILDFETVYPKSKLVKLEQNYRSSKNIISAASEVIKNNFLRKDKRIWTSNDEGASIVAVQCSSDIDEANYIASEIQKLQTTKVQLGDIAVFYRTNAQSRIIEDALRNHNLNYRIVGGIRFYERKEIKDILGYLRLIINKKDSLALSRVINVPARGVGATSLKKIEEISNHNQLSLWETMSDIVDNSEKYSNIRLSAKIKTSIREFCYLINELSTMDESKIKPSVVLEKALRESGYLDSIRASKDYESLARLENIEELINAVKQYENNEATPTVAGFLEGITLDSNLEEELEESNKEDNQIVLMTIHGSKGLEFPYVFVTGLEENIFPNYRSIDAGSHQIEEERRLFYVAMTRAMKKLYLTHADGRMQFGSVRFNPHSRFIDEIPEVFLDKIRLATSSRSFTKLQKFEDFEQEHFNQEVDYDDHAPTIIRSNVESVSYKKNKFNKGAKIVHRLYGNGIVLYSEGSGSDEKVTIKFHDGTIKKFMVKFAPLELV